MRFLTNHLAARPHIYFMDTLCALTIVFPSVLCVCSFCMYHILETPWSTWIAQCLQLRPTTSPSTTNVSMVMRITIRGRIFPKGGGDDAEHPSFIPMYTPTTLQTPRGHMMRPRTYATGIKVNPLFFENIMNIHWTCLLPHQSALCVLRYEDRRPQAGEEHPKGVGEGPQGHKEEEGVQQDQLCTSQATPCPRASKTPCARTTQRAGAGAPRAHGPNLPRAHGLIRMDGRESHVGPPLRPLPPPTYIYPSPSSI